MFTEGELEDELRDSLWPGDEDEDRDQDQDEGGEEER